MLAGGERLLLAERLHERRDDPAGRRADVREGVGGGEPDVVRRVGECLGEGRDGAVGGRAHLRECVGGELTGPGLLVLQQHRNEPGRGDRAEPDEGADGVVRQVVGVRLGEAGQLLAQARDGGGRDRAAVGDGAVRGGPAVRVGAGRVGEQHLDLRGEWHVGDG